MAASTRRGPGSEAIARGPGRVRGQDRRRGGRGPRADHGPDDRGDAQGRARRPPGLPEQRQGPKATSNRRNGYTPKRLRTSAGEVEVAVPRDRDGTFEPVAVPKGSRDLFDVEGRVLSMYAQGMSQRDIAATACGTNGSSTGAGTVPAFAVQA